MVMSSVAASGIATACSLVSVRKLLNPSVTCHASITTGVCYPFMPVNEMPSMKVRWAKKKAKMMGKATIVLTAIR